MSDTNTVELDVGDSESIDVEVNDNLEVETDSGSDDQFDKAETSTQKRISRLTKKMREAERREQEAIKYAQAVQGESQDLKNRMSNLDTNYVAEYTSRVNTQIDQAEATLTRAIEIGDSKATKPPRLNSTKLNSRCLLNSLNGLTLKPSHGPCVTVGLAKTKQ
jgi:hypothetical protein